MVERRADLHVALERFRTAKGGAVDPRGGRLKKRGKGSGISLSQAPGSAPGYSGGKKDAGFLRSGRWWLGGTHRGKKEFSEEGERGGVVGDDRVNVFS